VTSAGTIETVGSSQELLQLLISQHRRKGGLLLG
jgi:hypothetical protein